MKALLAAMLVLVAGCASSSEPVQIEIVNHTSFPVTGVLEAGILSSQVTLWPHQNKIFVVYREYLPSKVRFVLIDLVK